MIDFRVLFLGFCLIITASANLGAQDVPLGGNRYRPDLQFRTISTARFDIHFHQGTEALAQRLARIVDAVAPPLEQKYGPPTGRVRIILVDQTDVSNGWATVVPYNLIEIVAAPPAGRSLIGNTDDWLRLVFTHEYTHLLHLEKSGGWFGSLRHVFGRVPAFYPNLFVPDWQIEGLATFEESASTGMGRIPAGDFRAMLDRAALEERFPALDQATSATIDWPGGSSSYLFGAYFHQYLADTYGRETLARLADATASRLPFFGSHAYKEIYGQSLGTLWREFEAESVRRASPSAASGERARLTTHGFTTSSPVFSSDGRVFYAAATPHEFPAIHAYQPDGTRRRVATRYHGGQLSTRGDVLVFDQFEVAANVALASDLYARRLTGGSTRALTRGARAADPDLSPDGGTIVCTVQQAGRRILATLPYRQDGPVTAPTPIVAEDDTDFSAPRWSPDGRTIVAERRRRGGPSEIVLIDGASHAVRVLVSTPSGRNILPTWLPDGDAIFFSSDRDGRPFTLYTLTLADGSIRRLDATGTGAQAATVSPDGRRVVFVGYSADGYDLYSIPYDAVRSTTEVIAASPAAPDRPAVTRIAESSAGASGLPTRRYSPLGTLLPRFWIPYIEIDGDDTILGATTSGFDALGRHAYTATGGWAVPMNRADLQFDYTYARWWPLLFLNVSDDTDAWPEGHIRSREFNAGVLLPWRRVRWNTAVLAAASVSRDDFERASDVFPDRPDRTRDALRFGWTLSNARAYGYSISAEEGASVNVVSEFARGGSSGVPGSASSVAGSLRAYLRTWPRHGVLAARIAGATSSGDERVRRGFSAGGAGPRGGGFDIGVDAIGLLRGFEEEDFFGRSAAVLNTDYRFPLGWPQRGIGTLPVFLRSVHGAVFVDLGHAWDDRFDRDDLRRSAGAELSFDFVFGSFVPATIATGVAWRDDPSGVRTGPAFFARIGRAF